MISKKYAGDFRIEQGVGANGRIETRAVYIGKYYRFIASDAAIAKFRTAYLVAVAAGILCFVMGFAVYDNSGITAQYYTSFPHAFCLFPLGYEAVALIYLCRYNGRMTHERRDKITERTAKSSVCGFALSGLAAVGCVIAALLSLLGATDRQFILKDLFYALCVCGLTASQIFVFFGRKTLETEECREREAG